MKKQKPFFAKFLENQFSAEEAKEIKGGDDIIVTLKFPSDAEDNGGNGGNNGPCVNPGNGNAYGTVNNPNCDPIFVTLKYPSDAEDTGGGDPI